MTLTSYLPLDPASYPDLIETLGDHPQTLISVHHLQRGSCKAYLAGEPKQIKGLIIQHNDAADEPTGFGDNAQTLATLLQSVSGWGCVCVSSAVAEELGQILGQQYQRQIHYLDDLYYQLLQPAAQIEHPAVRLLSPDDLHLFEHAPENVQPSGFGSIAAALEQGIVAGAVIDDQIAAISFTSARSLQHADIAVNTNEAWRNQGLASAAASLVAQAIQASGQTPVWSAGAHNIASLRIAEKLGFSKVSQRRYIILGDTL